MTMTTADRSRCSVQVRQLLAQGSLFLLQQLPAAATTRRAVGPLRDPSLSIALSIATAAPDGFSPLLWDRAIVLRSRRGEAMEMEMEMEWGKWS